MFKKLFLSFLLIFYLFFPQSTIAQENWVITDFSTDLTLNRDTSLQVTETISVDFGTNYKHGIYRTLPVRYQTPAGNTQDIRFNLISITDQNSQSLQYQQSAAGDYITLKIGDPDTTITGPNTYIITYHVNRVVTKLGAQAELAWNSTGHNWPVPILKTTTTLHAPTSSLTRTICFTGHLGSQSQNCTHGHDTDTAIYTATGLDPGTGFTIATTLDPNSFDFPSETQQFIWFIHDNWPYFLPIATFIIMLYVYWQKGRDKTYKTLFSNQSTTLPLFSRPLVRLAYSPPKDLTPGEVGTLIDERVNHSDITATIIDLARRGHITIKEGKPTGIIFKKPRFTLFYHPQEKALLTDHEQALLDMLFTTSRHSHVDIDNLPVNSYKHLIKAQKSLYLRLTDNGYFLGNPSTVRIVFFAAGISITLISLFFIAPALSGITSPTSSYVGTILSGLIITAFSPFMSARTAKGRRALEEILGLREWIRLGAWREQIHEKNNFFEEVLPFTIAFGMTGKFLKAFKNTNLKSPSWYQGKGTFNPIVFHSALTSFDTNLTTSIASTRPRSSSGSSFGGGGSSGGGFGGGGGGSW